MKKTLMCAGMAALLVMGMAACSDKKKGLKPEEEEWMKNEAVVASDSVVFGLCTDGSAMNTLQIVTDSGDTLTLNTAEVKEAGRLFGGYAAGDRMALMIDGQTKALTMVVNESTLMGNWVMPSPYDGTSSTGISIKDGGIAEGINQSSIIYKTWSLTGGHLEVVSVHEGGGDFEEVELFDILYLTNDSLALKESKNKHNAKEPDVIYEYSRPKPADTYDDLRLNLEEDNFDDFVM